MTYVDFAELKKQLPIDQAIPLLGLDLKFGGDQWRGPCPACERGGSRALVITPAKHAFYCFGSKTGGDVIALAAHIRNCGVKDAAGFLAGEGNSTSSRKGTSSSQTVPEKRNKEAARSLQPLTYLEPGREVILQMGLEEETVRTFGAGYAPKGIMRGRLAIPVHDRQGELIAYCGRTVKAESPTLIFPNGFDPAAHIFNAHALGEGELTLMRDPLDVLIAYQNGIENVVAFFTETLSAQQLEMLASLMDEKGVESAELF